MELIFEIGCEELPARFVDSALEQIRGFFETACERERIEIERLQTVGTPRRLALLVDDLAETQTDLETEQTGPPVEAAFDDGEPTAAAEGFASAHGVDASDLYVAETDKGEFAALSLREEGEEVVELLPTILDELIRSLDFPKSMRWAGHDERFGRPVRWLVAVAGGEVVDVSFAGVESGAQTRGHQFAAPDPFEVRSIEEYESGLEDASVVPDPDQRRTTIVKKLDRLADEVGSAVVDDPGLLDEVVHLIEYPLATRLDYDRKYLELPREVLVTSMRSHQRYFAFEDPETGELTPHCGVVYNTPVEDPDVVNRGNLRVLRARLEDAMFFWNNDRERTLESRLEDLERVVWIDDLEDGTMRDRAVRIAETARDFGREYLDGADYEVALAGTGYDGAQHLAQRAGRLSKCDLVTDMVDEFPKLEGIMGREYARADGEPEPVARAIGEQYLPGGAEGGVPETEIGAVVALSEKVVSLSACFEAGLEPTSSSDPYGLRRAALGLLRIVLDRGWSFSWVDDIEGGELTAFVERRFRHLLERTYPTDVVNAVFASGVDDVVRTRDRVRALADLRAEPDFEELTLGYKRIVKMVEDEDLSGRVVPDRLEAGQSRDLYDAARAVDDRLEAARADGDWREACRALMDLKGPIDDFLDAVMVNVDDDALRTNRLRLLDVVRQRFLQVADISRMEY